MSEVFVEARSVMVESYEERTIPVEQNIVIKEKMPV